MNFPPHPPLSLDGAARLGRNPERSIDVGQAAALALRWTVAYWHECRLARQSTDDVSLQSCERLSWSSGRGLRSKP